MAIVQIAIWLLATATRSEPAVAAVSTDPALIRLVGPMARQMILVEATTTDGQTVDMTRSARYRALDTTIATVDREGVVRPVGDGRTMVAIDAAGKSRTVAVQVEGSAQPRSFNFLNDIIPVLSRLGCNSSACHGKARANGFKLSVFGFDPAADHAA